MKKMNLKTLVIAGLASGGLLMSCAPQSTDKTASCTPKKPQEATQKRVVDNTAGGSGCPSSGGGSCSGNGSSCSGASCSATKKGDSTSGAQKHMKNQRASAL